MPSTPASCGVVRVAAPSSLRAFAGALCLLLALGGCAAGRPSPADTGSGRMEQAQQLFDEERYNDVILLLTGFLNESPGSRYVDGAMFLLGRAQYEQGNFFDAEEQFRRVRRDFPESPHYCEANYYLALALLSQALGPQLDQTERETALVELQSFLSRCPDSPYVDRAHTHILEARNVLAEKELINGKTYKKLKSPRAAIHYFRKVVEKFPETKWVPEALLEIGRVHAEREEWQEALPWLEQLIAEHPDAPEAGRARELAARARAKVGAASTAAGTETGGEGSEP